MGALWPGCVDVSGTHLHAEICPAQSAKVCMRPMCRSAFQMSALVQVTNSNHNLEQLHCGSNRLHLLLQDN